MRILFAKDSLVWPRSSGHDVHASSLMRALASLGHEISLLTRTPVMADAVRGLGLARCDMMAAFPNQGSGDLRLSRLQERFRSYWGIDPAAIEAVGAAADEWDAQAVVVVGLGVLPYLGAVKRALRVWYAADEWAWHHVSQVQIGKPASWANLRQAAVKGMYERAYAGLVDRVWVVSEADRRAMRWVAGLRDVDVVPNGVDSDWFRPQGVPPRPNSCVFWGRLDFGPNVQALMWFARRVWPKLRRRVPDARFTIYGFQPTPEVRALAGLDGMSLVPDLPDLRGEVSRHQVVVLPFVSGGGIKNKLLEAAALGQPIVCTPRACGGLQAPTGLPLVCCRHASAWVQAIESLWADESERQKLGLAARRWVEKNHTWEAAARIALKGLGSSPSLLWGEGVRSAAEVSS
jgi:glycosyltransferase involved in cell wall biosynthesis